MKTIISVALTLCVVAVAAPPPAASAGSSVAKDSAAAGRGVLVDSRDGKSYRTIRIGSQVWMAENLNRVTGNSGCYDNDTGNCTKWGRLYDWQTARSACPGGWHLPSDEEWRVLACDDDVPGCQASGLALKSSRMYGTDAIGFAALPGGFRGVVDGGRIVFVKADDNAYFWSSTKRDAKNARCRFLVSEGEKPEDGELLMRYYAKKESGFSVRCLKDGPLP